MNSSSSEGSSSVVISFIGVLWDRIGLATDDDEVEGVEDVLLVMIEACGSWGWFR